MKVGDTIIAYGQQATIESIEFVGKRTRYNLTHSIVVPGMEYTRDYVYKNEILSILAGS